MQLSAKALGQFHQKERTTLSSDFGVCMCAVWGSEYLSQWSRRKDSGQRASTYVNTRLSLGRGGIHQGNMYTVHIHTCTLVHTYRYVQTQSLTCIHIHSYTLTCTLTCAHIFIPVHIHSAYTHADIHTCAHIYTYAHTCACCYMCAHLYTHTCTLLLASIKQRV